MSKKYINYKEAQKFIVNERNNGKSDQEIYTELAQQYYDKKSIALLITGTATQENRNKYKILKYILLGLLGIVLSFNLFLTIKLYPQDDTFLTHLYWFLILLLFTGFFIYAIYRNHAGGYWSCLVITIFLFLSRPMSYLTKDLYILINVTLLVLIVGVLTFLIKKTFPNYRPYKMKKDTNGEYII